MFSNLSNVGEVRTENYDKLQLQRYIYFDDVVCKICEHVKRTE